MKKNILAIFLGLLGLISCKKKNEYKYVLIWEYTNSKFNDSPIKISAPNDSIAYSIAYNEFITKQKNYYLFQKEARNQKLEYWGYEPVDFILVDKNNKDLSSGDFLKNKESLHGKIKLKAGMPTTMTESSRSQK